MLLEETVPYFSCSLCGTAVNPWANAIWLSDVAVLCEHCGTVGKQNTVTSDRSHPEGALHHSEQVPNVHEAITLTEISVPVSDN